jgi:hypothetical protein
MNTFILKTILFVSLIMLIIAGVGQFDNLDKYDSDNDNIARLNCKSSFDSLDILFIGNSYTYSGINTSYLDSLSVNGFNLGIATAGPYFYDLVVNDYLQEVKRKPQYIFLLVSPISFSSKSDNFVAYPIHRYLGSPLSNEEVTLKFGQSGQYLNLSSKSFKKGLDNIVSRMRGRRKKAMSCEDVRLYKGFTPSSTINNPEIVRSSKHLYDDFRFDSFDGDKAGYLLDLAARLEKRGIDVVFYSLPTNSLKHYFKSEYLNDYSRFLSELRKKSKFINVELPENDRYFRNIDHLNSAGARLVTHELIAEMDRILVMRD